MCVQEIFRGVHSNESYCAVHMCSTVCFSVFYKTTLKITFFLIHCSTVGDERVLYKPNVCYIGAAELQSVTQNDQKSGKYSSTQLEVDRKFSRREFRSLGLKANDDITVGSNVFINATLPPH